MEQVFRNDIRDGCIEFPKLKKLTLHNLPNLTAFSQGLQNIKFPQLTDLEIEDLPKLNSFCPLNFNSETANDDTNSVHCHTNPKVEIGGLKTLRVSSFYYNNISSSIWCHQIPINFFDNLEELVIFEINGIRSLMSYSIVKNLVSLKDLQINNCEDMVEVIEGNDDDNEVVDVNCLFPTLKYLNVEDLPKLRRFWQWNHPLELPLLEHVNIEQCPLIETFTMGSLSTPNLKSLIVNSQEIEDMKDLNDIQHHH